MRNSVKIAGFGSYVPEKVLTNDDLSKIVDTSDEWIRTRTGIGERHIADSTQFTSDLCTLAAQAAMRDAGVDSVDLILIGTVTPDMSFPSTAAIVQRKLGLKNIPCFDFESACAGFQYGTELATMLCSKYDRVLLICGDKMSAITDWQDRSTCVLFGDGAGAVVFSRDDEKSSIVDVLLGSNGNFSHLLEMPAGGSACPASAETIQQRKHFVKMAGREVFREAVLCMTSSCQEILKRNGLTIDDIDFVVPHQANIRIIEAIRERLNIPQEKVQLTVHKYGNTSASSCIIALDDLRKSGKLQKNMKILTVSFGAGLTWGASILQL